MAMVRTDKVRTCSSKIEDGRPCDNIADYYAGGKYAGDWADNYCRSHIPSGFRVWDTYIYELEEYANTSTTFDRRTN